MWYYECEVEPLGGIALVVEIRVVLDTIEARKVGEVSLHSSLRYNLETLTSNIEERTEARAIIRFTFTIETEPKVVTFLAKGKATMTGTEGEVNAALKSSSNGPPEVLRRIFQENIVTFYQLSKAMDIPPPRIPLPWGEVKQ